MARAERPAVVFYDGACGMCADAAAKGRRWQRPGAIEWVDAATGDGRRRLAARGLLEQARDSLVVVEGDRVSLESTAAVRTALRLRWPWKAWAALWLVPRPWRDAAYRRIAAKRMRDEACVIGQAGPRDPGRR